MRSEKSIEIALAIFSASSGDHFASPRTLIILGSNKDSARKRNDLICGNAEVVCNPPQNVRQSLYTQRRHGCTIRIHPRLPPCCCEFRHATVVVGDAVNIYRLSLYATSCLTKINYSSRSSAVVSRNIIEPRYL